MLGRAAFYVKATRAIQVSPEGNQKVDKQTRERVGERRRENERERTKGQRRTEKRTSETCIGKGSRVYKSSVQVVAAASGSSCTTRPYASKNLVHIALLSIGRADGECCVQKTGEAELGFGCMLQLRRAESVDYPGLSFTMYMSVRSMRFYSMYAVSDPTW